MKKTLVKEGIKVGFFINFVAYSPLFLALNDDDFEDFYYSFLLINKKVKEWAENGVDANEGIYNFISSRSHNYLSFITSENELKVQIGSKMVSFERKTIEDDQDKLFFNHYVIIGVKYVDELANEFLVEME